MAPFPPVILICEAPKMLCCPLHLTIADRWCLSIVDFKCPFQRALIIFNLQAPPWREDGLTGYVQSLLYSSANQKLFEKNVYKVVTMKIMEAIMCLPQIDTFHCEQRWMGHKEEHCMVSLWRMYCMYSGMAKGTSQAGATSNNENQTCSLSHCQVTLVWRHQLVSQSASQSIENSMKYISIKFRSSYLGAIWI